MEKKKITLEQAVEYCKNLIADYQWAYVCQDAVLMDIIAKARVAFENGLFRDYGENFMLEYFNAINA